MSGVFLRNPKQVLKNQSDNPGRVTNWTTRNYADNVITQENRRTQHIRTRKPKGQSCNPSRQRRTNLGLSQGEYHAMWKGCCPKQHPYRYAKNRRLGLTHRWMPQEQAVETISQHSRQSPGSARRGTLSQPGHSARQVSK